jgi:hypothetical protein
VASGYTSWAQVGSSSAINAGEGFTMKGLRSKYNYCKWFKIIQVANSAMILEENLMMGPFQITVLNLQFTLTEPIHLQSIYQLFEQTNCTGIAYFWRQNKQFHILLRIIKAVVFLFGVGQAFMCLQPSMMVLVMKVR